MKITKKDLGKSQVQLTIEVPEDKIQKFREQAVKKVSEQVKIDGFRKGHIPEKVLLEQVGEQPILSEMIDIALPNLMAEAIQKEDLSIIARPDIDIITITPFVFEAKIALVPEIEIKDWESVEVKKKKVSIKKKEIEEVIENLRTKFTERKPVERAAKKDDFVEVDFAGKTPDGVPLEGTESKQHPLILGLGTFIPGFEENMIGMKAGEEKEFEITFPKDYHAKHLAGKPVVFTVKMNQVSEQIKPEVNEEFIEKIFGKKMKVKEAEEEIEKILMEKAEDEERTRRENELIEAWAKNAKGDLPDVIVDEEVNMMLENIKQQAAQSQLPWEKYLENMKKTEEEVKKEIRPEAEKRSKQRFVLGKILSMSEIDVTDQEIESELHSYAHATGQADPHAHVEKGSDQWRQSEHRIRITKLFDRFLTEEKKEEKKK